MIRGPVRRAVKDPQIREAREDGWRGRQPWWEVRRRNEDISVGKRGGVCLEATVGERVPARGRGVDLQDGKSRLCQLVESVSATDDVIQRAWERRWQRDMYCHPEICCWQTRNSETKAGSVHKPGLRGRGEGLRWPDL